MIQQRREQVWSSPARGSPSRRFPLSCLAAVALVSASVALFPGWDRSAFRLASAATWVVGLVVLWFGALPGNRLPARVGRELVGPPLSPEAERIALVAVFVVALAFRIVLLADVPPFVSNDESMFSFETSWRPEHRELFGSSLLQGWPYGWFPQLFGIGWNGFPTLSYGLHWLPVTVLGLSNWSLRVGCAVVGLGSIVLLYRWARRWWGSVVALCAALALSINIEHVYWSRMPLNNIDAALLGAWALAALAWALDTRSWRAWVSFGYALGFGFHTYHGAKLHVVLAAIVLLVLIVTRVEQFSWSDTSGLLTATLAAVLVVAPLMPEIITHWASWYGNQDKQLDLSLLISALWQGNIPSARFYVDQHFADTMRLFWPAPVMLWVCVLGSAVALWHWKDPRYLTALLWMTGVLFIGSATVGWRSARLIGAAPVMSLMPALLVGHIRATFWAGSRAGVRRIVSLGAVALLLVLLYESWSVEFLWRPRFPNVTYGICRLIRRVPLPATFYVAGKGGPFPPEEAAHICTIPDDGRRRFVSLPPGTSTPQEIANDPNVVAIVYANRPDVLEALRQRYPKAIEESFFVNGPNPSSGNVVPGTPYEHGAAFYVVRLRTSCPFTLLLNGDNPC